MTSDMAEQQLSEYLVRKTREQVLRLREHPNKPLEILGLCDYDMRIMELLWRQQWLREECVRLTLENVELIAKGVGQAVSEKEVHRPDSVESVVRAALNDVALVIGSAAVLHQLDDNLVWAVMKQMDRIRIRLFRELKGLPPFGWYAPEGVCPPRLHPAVKEFILRNGDGMGERS